MQTTGNTGNARTQIQQHARTHMRALAISIGISLVVVAFIAGCRVNSEPFMGHGGVGGKPEMVLRAYDVPKGQAQELRNIVSSLLWAGDGQPRTGNVVVAPTGQLLVSAPAPFHEGVKQLAESVRAMPEKAPEGVAIDYWIVRGTPSGETKVGDDVPKIAASALEQLGGGMTLSLWDHTRISSIANERAEVERRGAKFSQTVDVQGKTVNADININTEVGKVQLRTSMPLDSARVLIQAADVAPGSSTAQGAVFYVVRASLAQ